MRRYCLSGDSQYLKARGSSSTPAGTCGGRQFKERWSFLGQIVAVGVSNSVVKVHADCKVCLIPHEWNSILWCRRKKLYQALLFDTFALILFTILSNESNLLKTLFFKIFLNNL